MKTKLWKLAAVAACLGVGATQSPAQAQDTSATNESADNGYNLLQVKLQPGTTYRMQVKAQVKLATNAKLPGKAQPQRMEMWINTTQDANYKALYRLASGGTRIRTRYGATHVKITNKVNGKTEEMGPLPGISTSPYTGLELEMTVLPTGQLTDVRGLEKLWKRALNNTGTSLTPAQRRQMEASFKKTLSGDALQNAMQQAGIAYPERALRIGESWARNLELQNPFPMRFSVKRTLQGVEGDIATIADTGGIAIGNANEPIDLGTAKAQMQLTGSYTGTSRLHTDNGFTGNTQATMRFGGSIRVPDPSGKMVTIPMFYRAFINVNIVPAQ